MDACDLRAATLTRSEWIGATLRGCDFRDADLGGVILADCGVEGCRLGDVRLVDAVVADNIGRGNLPDDAAAGIASGHR